MKNKNNEATHQTTILSIDGATHTGYAIYRNGRIFKHGTKVFKPSTHESKHHKYGTWLRTMIARYNVTEIVAEDVFRKHGNDYEQRVNDNTANGLAKMQGVLQYVSEENGILPAFIQPLDWKRVVIPSHHRHVRETDKQWMLNKAKHLGYQLEKEDADDEADAIGIMIGYLERNNIPVEHPNQE